MSFSSQYAPVTHSGNGVATQFNFSFAILAGSQVKVTLIDAGGNESVPAFTVTGNLGGGSVTITPAPASGTTVKITRETAVAQAYDFTAYGAFQPATHEQAFDAVVMMLQELSYTANELVSPVVQQAIQDMLLAYGTVSSPPTRYTTATKPAPSSLLSGVRIRVKDPGSYEQEMVCLETGVDGVYEWFITAAGGI